MDIFGNKSSVEIFAEYFPNEKQETAMERAFREAQEKAKKEKK